MNKDAKKVIDQISAACHLPGKVTVSVTGQWVDLMGVTHEIDYAIQLKLSDGIAVITSIDKSIWTVYLSKFMDLYAPIWKLFVDLIERMDNGEFFKKN